MHCDQRLYLNTDMHSTEVLLTVEMRHTSPFQVICGPVIPCLSKTRAVAVTTNHSCTLKWGSTHSKRTIATFTVNIVCQNGTHAIVQGGVANKSHGFRIILTN